MTPPRIAIQGERGAYSEEAAVALFGADADIVPCRRLADVFAALDGGAADGAAVPVENSRAGTVVEAYDLLLARTHAVTGELRLRVRHCLLGLPGADIGGIRRARSHPQALAQCQGFLSGRAITAESAYDTAGSAKELAAAGDASLGAIASRRAAAIYGLAVLAEGIEDRPDNVTRFVAVGRAPSRAAGFSKSLLAFSTPNEPGALVRCLEPFARRGLNLSKIESRPDGETPFAYVFYLDVDHRADQPEMAAALQDLGRVARSVRLLGSFGA